MLKKRLIFTLLYNDGKFSLSRNFGLQAAGDLEWIRKYYDFDAIAYSIDELIILNVSRHAGNTASFADAVAELGTRCFMPIAAGGKVRSAADAQLLLNSGADKIVVNTPLFSDPALVEELVDRFGSQCLIASIDYRRSDTGSEVFIENGQVQTATPLPAAIARAKQLGAGELYLTSMTRDGTGQGMDDQYVSEVCKDIGLPVIVSGGAGTFDHLGEALTRDGISAASTANLFNFMGSNLTETRRHIIGRGIPLATWRQVEIEGSHG